MGRTQQSSASYMTVTTEEPDASDPAGADAGARASNNNAWCCGLLPRTNNIMFTAGICLEIVLALTFCGFTLYALLEGNTDGVRAACPKLWEFMVARSIAAVVVTMLFILLYIYTLNAATSRDNQNPEWASMDQRSPFSTQNMMYALFIALFIYFGAFFAAGVSIIPANIPNSELCADTLSATVLTGTPILGITAWIACILDGVLAIGIAILIGYTILSPQP